MLAQLLLAPSDLAAFVKQTLSEFGDREPVALRVSAVDAGRVQAALPVRVDPALRAGDLVVEVRLVLPKLLDERSKELLREFGRINHENVRGHSGSGS